ncbi:hypothetical protein EXU30_20135 [Shewanella maritima]|uniref:Uncharacterized protein n=1 Tax=Shewanella maritima TaxID=2520507 RepID=A0A411PME9_9GAMM|nr:hypothetical protein [Shewanella maritima]QBF84720.1 hypothetical protein EXU30_20135 [Shewanella maritima]
MRKNISQLIANSSLLLLSFIAAAIPAAANNSIDLLVNQCLSYQVPIPKPLTDKGSLDQLATTYTQYQSHLLGLYNLSDRVSYYRQFASSSEQREKLLSCQIKLNNLLTDTAIQSQDLLQRVQQSNLGAQFSASATQLLSEIEPKHQAQLSDKIVAASTAYRHNFNNKKLAINIAGKPCQLVATSNLVKPSDVAKYLLKQQNAQCRKLVWLDHQIKSKTINQSILQDLWQIYQQQAHSKGYVGYSQMQLAKHQLNSQQIDQFFDNLVGELELKTDKVAPWDIPAKLKHAGETKETEQISYNNSIPGHQLLNTIFKTLSSLQYRFEQLEVEPTSVSANNNKQDVTTFRVWQQQRLLGELSIITHDNKNISANMLKQTVVGEQFGSWAISLPNTELSQRNQAKLIERVSRSIVSLSQTNRFYNLNHLPQNSEQQITQYWLTAFIKHNIGHTRVSQRQKLMSDYTSRLRLFRAVLAYEFFALKSFDQQTYAWHQFETSANERFVRLFGEDLEHAVDLLYSYRALVNEGPVYFLPIWYEHQANQLFDPQADTASLQQTYQKLLHHY